MEEHFKWSNARCHQSSVVWPFCCSVRQTLVLGRNLNFISRFRWAHCCLWHLWDFLWWLNADVVTACQARQVIFNLHWKQRITSGTQGMKSLHFSVSWILAEGVKTWGAHAHFVEWMQTLICFELAKVHFIGRVMLGISDLSAGSKSFKIKATLLHQCVSKKHPFIFTHEPVVMQPFWQRLFEVAVDQGRRARGWGSATWSEARDWSTPAGSPGWRCLMFKDQNHLMTPGNCIDDESRYITRWCNDVASKYSSFWTKFIRGIKMDTEWFLIMKKLNKYERQVKY